jgi:hypothetical protein
MSYFLGLLLVMLIAYVLIVWEDKEVMTKF